MTDRRTDRPGFVKEAAGAAVGVLGLPYVVRSSVLGKCIGRLAGRPSGEVEQLRKRVADLEQLADDQTFTTCTSPSVSAPAH